MAENNIIFNEVGRLRSGWRFIIYLLSFLIISTIVGVLTFVITQALTGDSKATFLGTPPGMAITAFISTIIATLLGWFYGKLLEDLPLKALGWVFNRTWLKDFLIGLFLGAITLTVAVIIAMPGGGVSLMKNQTSDTNAILMTILTSFGVFFIAAAFEEVLFRGYILQTLMRSKLALLGILLTSLPFAVAHLGNPSAGSISTLNTALAGIWFGIAYLKTRSLWLAFGLHLSWNWFQGAFYGINVSGLSQIAPDPLFRTIDQGPTWLTGGHYGIEGGITCTIALILSTVLIWFLPILQPTEDMLALTSQENPKKLS